MDLFRRNVASAFVAIMFSFIFTHIGYLVSVLMDLEGTLNIKIFICQSILFIFVYLVTFFRIKSYDEKSFFRAVSLMGLVFLIYFIIFYFFEETIYPFNAKEYLRHHIPFFVYFGGVVLTCYCANLLMCKNLKIPRPILCLVVSVVAFCLGYAPNVYRDSYNCLYHIHAYINSIENAVNGGAFSKANASIYGHYAIIYLVPVKILKYMGINQLYAIILIVAVLIGLCYLFLSLSSYRLIKNEVVVLLTVIASMWPILQVMGNGQYYQVFPHRIIFPILYIWLVTKKINHRWFTIFVGILAMTWNLETGAVCVLAYATYEIYQVLDFHGGIKSIYKVIGNQLINFLVCFGGMWLLCSVYNLLCGGEMLTFAEIIYPMGGKLFNFSVFAKTLPPIFGGYFLISDLFLVVIVALICFKIAKKKMRKEYDMLFFLSVLGLGLMTYYYNRPVYSNIIIGIIPFCLVMGIIIDVLREKIESNPMMGQLETDKKALQTLRFILWVPLVAIAMAGVTCVAPDLMNRKETVWETKQLKTVRNEFMRIVPEDVIGFGQGVPELYSFCNRNTNIYLSDWSGEDMTSYSLDVVDTFLTDANEFVADVSLAQNYDQFSKYELFLFNIDGYSYGKQEALYQIGYYILPSLVKERAMNARAEEVSSLMLQMFGVPKEEGYNSWKKLAGTHREKFDLESIEEIYELMNKKEMDDESYIVAVHNVLYGINPTLEEVELEKAMLETNPRYELLLHYLNSDSYYQYIKNDYYQM